MFWGKLNQFKTIYSMIFYTEVLVPPPPPSEPLGTGTALYYVLCAVTVQVDILSKSLYICREEEEFFFSTLHQQDRDETVRLFNQSILEVTVV